MMELTTTFGILVVTSIILTWFWMKHKFQYWKNRGIYTPPYSMIFGNMKTNILQQKSFLDNTINFYNEFKSKGLKHGGIYMMWSPMYFPMDLDIIKSIMQVDFEHFIERGEYVNEEGDPLSAHLFSLGGKKWRHLRTKLTPTFTSGKMKMMYETVVNCTKGFHDAIEEMQGNALDIKEILGRFTTDVIGSCAFGLDCNSLKDSDSEFLAKGKAFFEFNTKAFLLFAVPEFMKFLNAAITPTHVSEFFMGVVKDTVAYREKNNISRKDFMDLLIQLKNKGKLVDDMKVSTGEKQGDDTITIEEIAAQAFVFFIAGFETSSTTMTYCLYELAKNKIIQDKVRADIRKVLEKYNGQITYDAAMEMHYLEQTINEALRKYPAVNTLSRVCTKEYKVPGTELVIEKGVKVLIPAIAIQRDPEYYPEPEKFDPDRFSKENVKSRPAFSFLAFGDGPRICIGARFGMMQSRVGLISLLLNYEFSINKKTVEPIEYDPENFITSTKGGIWLDVKKISEETVELLPPKYA